MAESIGNLYETAIPALSDTADIQEALRVYHYGAPSGSGVDQYPITNTDPTNLVIPSVAYHLYNLQNQITNFKSGLTEAAWTSKGVLISAKDPEVPAPISVGANGQVLTANSATETGLEWQVPQVTLLNTITMSNKTLLNSAVADGGIKFAGPTGNNFAVTLMIPTPTANKTIYFPDTAVTTMPNPTTTLVGTDTIQTLTNKTIAVGQLSGQVPITSGGTGANTVANARANLEVFNSQATSAGPRNKYSGKIYVADPAIVGATGASLDSPAIGDLWFW